ncbi:zinc finger BED domain-containing protein 1 [Elysia marginata]|uniref:Zinc finger BED domain-containing protein 1 n=1 Tax=Elysia marginata TaxID=1093978 RepID=A0AAV4FUZ8_9GAST|nr:zinc finger BED domain-containing protein 1 [Elysia marginata]
MKEAAIVLQPMQKLTTILSGEAYTTTSSPIPLVKGFRKMMEAVQGGREILKKELLVQIEKRPGRCEEKDRLAYVTLFDPRYKKSCFKDPLLLQKHVQAVTNEIANKMKVVDHIPDKSNQQTCQQSAEKPASDDPILDFLDDVESVIATPNYKPQAMVEM